MRRAGAPSQFTANVPVARGRVWVRRLLPALGLAVLALGLLAQVASADSMAVSPTHGQPADPITATYTYINPTGGPCPVGKLAINFWWDAQSVSVGSSLVTLDAKQNCVAVLPFSPSKVKGANLSPAQHVVIGGPGQIGARIPYTIDLPPPSPSPSPAASPTPTSTPTNAPSPVSRPSPTPPRASPGPLPTPTPSCASGATSPGCPSPSPTPCPAIPAGPRGPGTGLAAALVLGAVVPIGGLFVSSLSLFRRRDLAKLVSMLALAGLLAASMSCGRVPAKLVAATTPTPSIAVQSPTCLAS